MNHLLLATAVLSLLPSAAAVAAPPAPAGYAIKGFRHADFGMNEADARNAIGVDFPDIAIAEASNSAEGTRLLQVSLPKLEPGPGPATVTYIFGARSKALTTVKLAWLLPPTATPAERQALLGAGLQLAAFFQNATPKPPIVSSARVTGPNAVSLYAAADRRNAAIEVAANGVATSPDPAHPAPAGPALLRVTYIADALTPDAVSRP